MGLCCKIVMRRILNRKRGLMYQTIVEAVLRHGAEMPDKLAVGFKKNRIHYGELCRQIRAAAREMKESCQVRAGDRVMISAASKPDYVVAWLAAQYLGAVSIPIDKSAKAANVLDACVFFEPKLLLTDAKIDGDTGEVRRASLKELYAKAAREAKDAGERGEAACRNEAGCGDCDGTGSEYQLPEPDSVAEILFTTGTTGKPKGVMLTYENLYASTHNTWRGVGMLESDRVLIPLPLNHSVGMRVLRTALYIGASVVIQNGFTFAKELETNIEEYACTGLVSVPASIEVVYRQMQDRFAGILGRLRYMEFGAGSLSASMKKKLLQELPGTLIYNTWGSTETGGALFLNVSKHPDKLLSIGKPAEGVEFKVADSQGRELQARDIDTAGRMALRGRMQMAGYYRDPEQTKAALSDGWLLTNDMVYADEDGYVYMLGRADDIINVGGEKVSPVEVENIASEYEQIRECACIGADDPDGILGKVPILYAVMEGAEFQEAGLMKFLADRMERYKLPQRVVIVPKLPRNRMNKLDRAALARMWEDCGDKDLMNETVRDILNRRSVREFTDQKIPRAVLDMIARCGYYAPSGHNLQTWRFTVITDAGEISLLKDTAARVSKEKEVYFYGFQNPAAVILVSNDRKNKNGVQDCACAAENMMLAAQSYGIGSVWQNSLSQISDEPDMRELLRKYGIPDSHIVWAALLTGYPAKPGKLLAKKADVVRWVGQDA